MTDVTNTKYFNLVRVPGAQPASPPSTEEPATVINPPGSVVAVPVDHNSTFSKQGGDDQLNEFYHLTFAQFQALQADTSTRRISGGVIQWTGVGFNFVISPMVYKIEGTTLSILNFGSLALDSSSPTLNRTDAIFVDTDLIFKIRKGAEGPTFVPPTINPITEVLVGLIQVPAATTQPAGLTDLILYDENVETTVTFSGPGTGVSNDTADPYVGTFAIKQTVVGNQTTVSFTFAAEQHFETATSLSMWLQMFSAIRSADGLYARWIDLAGNQVGSTAQFTFNKGGQDPSIIDNYQFAAVEFSNFGIGSSLVKKLEITYQRKGTGTNPGWRIDLVKIEDGLTQPAPEPIQISPYIRNGVSSGYIVPPVVTINVDATKFDMSSGFGVHVDRSNLFDPIIIPYVIPARVGVSVDNLATSTVTFLYTNSAGEIVQKTTEPNGADRRVLLEVCQLGHTNNINIANVAPFPFIFEGALDFARDIAAFLGTLSSGNFVTPNGANLSINKAEGKLMAEGINFAIDSQNPNVRTFAEYIAPLLLRRTATGAGTNATILDVGNYGLAGVITSLVPNKYTNQRVYMITNGNLVVTYGQVVYNSMTDALKFQEAELYIKSPNLVKAKLICIIAVKSNATDLSDETSAVFNNIGFSSVGGGSGGSTLSTDIINALEGANAPSAANVFATMADVGGAAAAYLTDLDTWPVLKFDKNYRYIHEMSGPVLISVETLTPPGVVGNFNKLYIKANGVNKPTFTPEFEVVWDNWLNTTGSWNRFFPELTPEGKIIIQIEQAHIGIPGPGSGATVINLVFDNNYVIEHVVAGTVELTLNSTEAQVGYKTLLYVKADGINKPFWPSDLVVTYDNYLNTVGTWNRFLIEWRPENKAISHIINI
jgi:hypothetical protein